MSIASPSFIARLPKVELHVHLEGSMTPSRALWLAERHGVVLPNAARGIAGLTEAFVFRRFDDFIRLYLLLSSTLRDVDDFRGLIRDLGDRCAAQVIRYAEVTVTPLTHLRRGVSPDTLIEGLVEGRRAVLADHGVDLRWVLDVVRSFPDQAWPTFEFAVALARRDPGGVVGLGVGGPEAGTFALEPMVRMFDAGRAEGFRSLPHAGEMAGPGSVWFAIEHFKADRIGHGVRCLEDPRLVEVLAERGIPLEVCPSSNVLLGVASSLDAHPLPRLLQEGLRVTLASDDPTFFGTDLVAEYATCAAAFGWSEADVLRLVETGIDVSYMPVDRATALREELRAH